MRQTWASRSFWTLEGLGQILARYAACSTSRQSPVVVPEGLAKKVRSSHDTDCLPHANRVFGSFAAPETPVATGGACSAIRARNSSSNILARVISESLIHTSAPTSSRARTLATEKL